MPEIPLTDLLAYFDAVRAVTRLYLEQATDADDPADAARFVARAALKAASKRSSRFFAACATAASVPNVGAEAG